jgi:hypothetical protein
VRVLGADEAEPNRRCRYAVAGASAFSGSRG